MLSEDVEEESRECSGEVVVEKLLNDVERNVM